jgi:hypothetical protein
VFRVKGVGVVERNGIRIGGAVRQIAHKFIYSGLIFIAAGDITIGLWKLTISCSDLYTLFIH